MRTVYLILFSITASITLNAQIGNGNLQNNPFVGIWEYQDGNEIFRVEFYINDGEVWGNYEKVSIDTNDTETLIFKSNRDVGFGLTRGPQIFGGTVSNRYEGRIEDNTVAVQFDEYGSLPGTLKMEIISSNPTTATWKVTLDGEGRFHDDVRVFSIPTDVVMTKVE